MGPAGVTRRQVLGLGVAGVAALALPGCSDDATSEPEAPDRPTGQAHRRVIVVGAGLAGLTAALDLVEAGWEVEVLEARSRVGGRVHTIRDPFSGGLHAEAGGESIDTSHTRLQAMLRRFDLRTERRPDDKILDGLTEWRGTREPTSTFAARHGGKVGADYERYYDALAELAADVDPAHPERVTDAERYDARSLADFTDDLHLSPEARFLVDIDNRSEYNAEPSDISLLWVMQQSAVGPDEDDADIEAMRVHGGNDRLPEAMAAALGRRVHLGAPVTTIEHDADGVRVTADSTTYHGAWLVLACPLMPLRKVSFRPALPASVAATITGLDLGPAAKVTVEYRSRFWEERDLSGFTVSDQPFGIAWAPTDSYSSERGLLTAFITGDAGRAAAAQTAPRRIADVEEQFDATYPGSAPLRTGHHATTAWADEPFTGGGYAVHHPGQFLRFWPVLRAGHGRIRFAGEHTETLAGYMESAVRSGHRVAHELGTPPPR